MRILPFFKNHYRTANNGVWRSWLARTAGGREVAGSSPVTPTKLDAKSPSSFLGLFLLQTINRQQSSPSPMTPPFDISMTHNYEARGDAIRKLK